MQQVLFRLPIGENGIPIYGFGVMLLASFLARLALAKYRARKVGIDGTVIDDLALFLFLLGIVGARATYLILHGQVSGLGDFLASLVRIWDGGIVFYGGAIGGAIAFFLAYWLTLRFRPNVTVGRLCDVIAPTIALGLLVGRLGCYLNGCCYGQVACTTCPAVHFPMSAPPRYDLVEAGYQTPAGFLTREDIAQVTHVEPGSPADKVGKLQVGDVIVEVNGKKKVADDKLRPALNAPAALEDLLVAGWQRGAKELKLVVERDGKTVELAPFEPETIGLQPTQLYESISMALVILVLLAFDPLKRRDGQVLALVMICYGVHRYVNEQLRIDARPEGFEKYISILLVVGGIGLMAWLALRKAPPTTAPVPQPAAAQT